MTDVSDVVMDPEEKPLFKGEYGREKAATILVSIAFLESYGLTQRIDIGDCHVGECDHGRAFSLWQIHPGPTGLVLQEDGGYHYAASGEHGLSGEDLVRDRKLAIRSALSMTRQSLRSTKTLCVYTGESCRGEHPKADIRMSMALAWVKEHPFNEDEVD